jgi:hypothetical protein
MVYQVSRQNIVNETPSSPVDTLKKRHAYECIYWPSARSRRRVRSFVRSFIYSFISITAFMRRQVLSAVILHDESASDITLHTFTSYWLAKVIKGKKWILMDGK